MGGNSSKSKGRKKLSKGRYDEEAVANLRKKFDKYDVKKNGKITVAEIKQVLHREGVSAEQQEAMIKQLLAGDSRNHGYVNFKTFKACGLEEEKKLVRAQYEQCYVDADYDGDGKVGKNDLSLYISDIVSVETFNTEFPAWWSSLVEGDEDSVDVQAFANFVYDLRQEAAKAS